MRSTSTLALVLCTLTTFSLAAPSQSGEQLTFKSPDLLNQAEEVVHKVINKAKAKANEWIKEGVKFVEAEGITREFMCSLTPLSQFKKSCLRTLSLSTFRLF